MRHVNQTNCTKLGMNDTVTRLDSALALAQASVLLPSKLTPALWVSPMGAADLGSIRNDPRRDPIAITDLSTDLTKYVRLATLQV